MKNIVCCRRPSHELKDATCLTLGARYKAFNLGLIFVFHKFLCITWVQILSTMRSVHRRGFFCDRWKVKQKNSRLMDACVDGKTCSRIPCLFSDGIWKQGAQFSYKEIFNTFSLALGATVCASYLHELLVLDLDWPHFLCYYHENSLNL